MLLLPVGRQQVLFQQKKKLTKRIAKELLDKGWCRVTGLYTPKKPQLYDAVIRLDDSGGKYVSFKVEFDR